MIIAIIYMALGYWATGVTTHANKIFLGYGIGELFLERLCWAFILDLYARFLEGDVINKAEEAIRFHVDERSIQRDIDDIRIYLADRKIIGLGECRNIIYDRMQKGYVMR